MYIDDDITVDEIDAVSGTLTVGKINSKIDGTNTRSIIHFTKYSLSSGFDDLDIDIKLKGKTDPQTTIYVVVYGVKGLLNNVPVNLWDRLYYYDNTSLKYEVPIDMNNKDITGLNNLDVNGQIDVKGNKITGVAEGTNPNDEVNKAQWDAYNSYYYYTDDLKHNNQKNVNFPNFNKYPFMSDTTEIIDIQLDGYYHIIFTDHYKGNTNTFRIISNTNPIFIQGFYSKSD